MEVFQWVQRRRGGRGRVSRFTLSFYDLRGDNGGISMKMSDTADIPSVCTVYDEEVDDFKFTKKRPRAAKEPTAPAAPAAKASPAKQTAPPSAISIQESMPPPEPPTQKKADSKTRRRLPSTPDRDKPVRRSKRLSNEASEQPQASPQRPSHALSHANHARSPSPSAARPVTIEKKRKAGAESVEEQKTMRIQLPFQDTPVIRRNKEMRKTGVEGGSRRSSSGMRGRRASSLIDEGRGGGKFHRGSWSLRGDDGLIGCNLALPHAEVSATEFFKHISAELTEPRRMRCLLGWCGTRALPAKPDAPKESTPAANLEFQALQAGTLLLVGEESRPGT